MFRYIVLVLLITVAASGGEFVFEMEFPAEETSFFTHLGYTRISIPECRSGGFPGQPLLPVRTVVLAIPSGAVGVSVSLEESGIYVASTPGTIQPAAIPRPFSSTSFSAEMINEDPGIYSMNSFWPSDRLGNVTVGTKSGFKLVSFQIMPVRYNPVSEEVEFAQFVTATIGWSESPPADRFTGQIEGAMRQLESWIDNPSDLAAFAPVSTGTDAVEYLVITSSDYSDSFWQLVNYKNTTGITTELVDIAEVLSGTSGYDDPERLRNYIISRYSADGIEHVLLGGDETVIPTRFINLYCEGYSDYAPVDLYFSDLDGTWDENGDHNYGQPEDDLDLYSDISVGRALVGNISDAELFVERSIMYQLEPPPGDWLSTAMLCGAGLFTGYTGAKVCDSIAVNLPADWTVWKAYETAKYSDNFTTHIDIINDGTNWVHYAGHGNVSGIYWEGYPPNMMTNSIANELTNGDMAGIHHSIACMPGAFHSGECCAEALWHNPDGGAVSVLFNTSYGWEGNIPEMGVSEWMCVYLTEEVFQLGNTLIGEAFAMSKDRRVPLWAGGFDRELYCILDWQGYHDPTLEVHDGYTGISGEYGACISEQQADLGYPHPNPAAAGGSIIFNTSFGGNDAELAVFDLAGRMIWSRSLNEPGPVRWSLFGDSGLPVPPGVYFVRLRAGGSMDFARLVVIK